jgi:competence protein ComEA
LQGRPGNERGTTKENSMLKKILAVLAMLYAAATFAATDVNKATAAELDAIKGIGPGISSKIIDERKKGTYKDWQDFIDRVKGVGENNAAKFSAEGLTVNGASFKGAPATSTSAMAKDEKKDAKAAAKDEKKAAKEKEKEEKKAANDKAKEEKKAADDTAKATKKDAEARKDAKVAAADKKEANAEVKADTAKGAKPAASAASAKK